MQIGAQDALTLVVAVLLVIWAIRALARLLQLIILLAAAYTALSILRHPGSVPDALQRQFMEILPYLRRAWEEALPWIMSLLGKVSG